MSKNMKDAEISAMREQLLATLLPSGIHIGLTALQAASCGADCITATESAKRLKGRNKPVVKLCEVDRILGIGKRKDNWLPYRLIAQEAVSFWQNHQN